MLVRVVTLSTTVFVPFAKTSIRTVPHATPSTVFHVKTVTFWRTTPAIFATLSDFRPAIHATQLNVSHATRELSSKTKHVTFVQPDSSSA